jgi:hypothetical protein
MLSGKNFHHFEARFLACVALRTTPFAIHELRASDWGSLATINPPLGARIAADWDCSILVLQYCTD